MKIDVTLTLDVEELEGQSTQDTFEIFEDYLRDCFYDHEHVKKIIDFEMQEV